MTDDDSTENVLRPLGEKPSLHKIPDHKVSEPKPEPPEAKPFSTPATTEGKSAEFWKGYDEGYSEAPVTVPFSK